MEGNTGRGAPKQGTSTYHCRCRRRKRPQTGEQDKIDFRSREPPTSRKNVQKHPEADAEHVFTVEPRIARKEYHELRLRKPDGFLHSLHHHVASSAYNWNVRHSDRELNLGHRQNINRKDCWNFGCMVTGTWWHPGRGEGMPITSPLSPSLRRQRRKVIRTDTSNLVPEVEDPLLIPSSDPDDLDALRREPGGQTSTPVPVVGVALDVVVELNPLMPPASMSSSAEALSHPTWLATSALFPEKTLTRLIQAFMNTSWKVRRRG